jgi:5-methylcytosine-specific restriction endonuclease McrA
MPLRRMPPELWRVTRRKVWARDGGRCVRCATPVSLRTCHIDHKVSGKRGTNRISELRTLCGPCHVLRLDHRHRGMIAGALRAGIIGPDWRNHLWRG